MTVCFCVFFSFLIQLIHSSYPKKDNLFEKTNDMVLDMSDDEDVVSSSDSDSDGEATANPKKINKIRKSKQHAPTANHQPLPAPSYHPVPTFNQYIPLSYSSVEDDSEICLFGGCESSEAVILSLA